MSDKVTILARKPTVNEFCRLRASCRWSVPEANYCQTALDNSLVGFVAVDTATQSVVGMVRAVGDGMLINYIQDLIILPQWQGKGIGRRLMTAVMDELQRRALPGSDIALISAPKTEAFYATFGFARFKPEVPGMRRKL